MEGEQEVDSEMPPPQATSEWCSNNNQDRDSAKEGLTRSRKRSLPLSGEEGSGKLPAISPSSGKVAPLRPKKVLSTLGGRRVNPSGGDTNVPKPRMFEPGQAKVPASTVAPPRRALKTAQK